jgi:superfamily II DNA helicase RecQ
VLNGNIDILVVSGLGSSKRLLFFLPAFIERTPVCLTTVVVVPLVALTKDLIDRSNAHNINCDVWRGSIYYKSSLLVIIY